MTDTNGAKGEPRATPEDAEDAHEVVPAAGGTFGVGSDESGFGNAPLPSDAEPVDDAQASSSGDHTIDAGGLEPSTAESSDSYDSHIDVGQLDPDIASGNGGNDSVPANGGTFGVTHDESGYQSASGHPDATPYGGSGLGSAQGEFGAFSTPAGTPEMAPPQFGAEAPAASGSDTLAYVAVALGILALLLLMLPSWTWIAGGVLGVAAAVLGAMRIKSPGKPFAIIGLIAGIVAIAIAAATAVVVFIV
ncbi:MAG: hypothetical protein ACTHXA_14300 [Gulosibacter sp.]|uniref:hypothetical protein n=1 Tax=Gulosibacter sp. TaxID=2817531 RepID=UPI003F8E1F27